MQVVETLDVAKAGATTGAATPSPMSGSRAPCRPGAASSVFAGYYLPGDPFGSVSLSHVHPNHPKGLTRTPTHAELLLTLSALITAAAGGSRHRVGRRLHRHRRPPGLDDGQPVRGRTSDNSPRTWLGYARNPGRAARVCRTVSHRVSAAGLGDAHEPGRRDHPGLNAARPRPLPVKGLNERYKLSYPANATGSTLSANEGAGKAADSSWSCPAGSCSRSATRRAASSRARIVDPVVTIDGATRGSAAWPRAKPRSGFRGHGLNHTTARGTCSSTST